MSAQEMVSHCCGAEIHHGHCTKCEKPCREEPRRHNAATRIGPTILRAQARASSTDFSTMDRMPGPHALRAAALYVEEKLDFTTTWPHSFALAGYQWRADIDRIEPARSPDECMVAHIDVQCIASDTVFNKFKTIHHVENPDLPMDKDLKPDIAFTIKPTEHNPLLRSLVKTASHWPYPEQPISPEDVRDFYEAKLTSGELRVVKKATIIEHSADLSECSECHHKYEGYRETMPDPPAVGEFCRCGAQIVKG